MKLEIGGGLYQGIATNIKHSHKILKATTVGTFQKSYIKVLEWILFIPILAQGLYLNSQQDEDIKLILCCLFDYCKKQMKCCKWLLQADDMS